MRTLNFKEIVYCFFLSVFFIGLSIFFSYLSDKNKESRIQYGITNSLSNVTSFIGGAIFIFIFLIEFLPNILRQDIKLTTGI